VTLLCRKTQPPISVSPAFSSRPPARTLFPLFARLAPAPGEMPDSGVASGPGPEVLCAACQPVRRLRRGIQTTDFCITGACLEGCDLPIAPLVLLYLPWFFVCYQEGR
jgi:hypothetical protein